VREEIKVGDHVFVADGAEVFGAVRQVEPHGRPEIVIYVENAGDFVAAGGSPGSTCTEGHCALR